MALHPLSAPPAAPTGDPRRPGSGRVMLIASTVVVLLVVAVGAFVVFLRSSGPVSSKADPLPVVAASGGPAATAPGGAAPAGSGVGSVSKSAGTSPAVRKSAVARPAAPTKVTGMTELDARAATGALKAAGRTPDGKVEQALRWKDRNGSNLLVATRHVDATSNGYVTAATIRVVELAHLESHPVVLRQMNDPSGPPCEFDFTAGVNNDLSLAGDMNHDGYADVSVAWYFGCASDPEPLETKVAVLNNGHKYILRGTGWLGLKPDIGGESLPSGRIDQTAPPASAWPTPLHERAEYVYTKLFLEP